MPSWTDIQQHARSNYKLQKDEEEFFGLGFQYEDSRTQMIYVKRFSFEDSDWVEFRSVVCTGSQMEPKVALEWNEKFAVGALALDSDGDYVIVHRAPLATMQLDEFELPLHAISSTADQLEKTYASGSDRW